MEHRRRKRYGGTHPRAFEDRYKELDPERYPGEAGKARARGGTPAGGHVPVLLAEVLEALRPVPGEVLVDCTVGLGGHAEALGRRLLPGGRIVAIDLDREVLERTAAMLRQEGLPVGAHPMRSAGIAKALRLEGLEAADLVIADLGVSSLQVDDPARGFSFKRDGPLDMRMDRSRGVPAAEWLRGIGEAELAGILGRLGEEPDAATIAAAIAAAAGSGRAPATTGELARLVLAAKGLGARHRQASAQEGHPAARTFQAIRMAVNGEEESLAGLLRVLPHVLRPGGRAGIITFHDVEDRRVAEAFDEGVRAGWYESPLAAPVPPTAGEVRGNPRARSARLRAAVRRGP